MQIENHPFSDPRTLLVESQYVGSIQWYARLLHHPTVCIEQHEHFERLTLRNRCHLLGANGILTLSIPLEHGRQQRRTIREVRISYAEPWQRIHWQSWMSCYRSSPFFEYYEDDFRPLYEQQPRFLFDFNQAFLEVVQRLLKVKLNIRFTETYQKDYDAEVLDYRSRISPKPIYQPTDAALHPTDLPTSICQQKRFSTQP